MLRTAPFWIWGALVLAGCEDGDKDTDTDTDVDTDVDTDGGDTDTDVDTDTTPAAVVVDCGSVTPDQEVSLVDLSFDPAEVTISVGEVVRWSNDETTAVTHTVTSGNPGDADLGDVFEVEDFTPGETFCVRFDVAGAYPYFCEIHPDVMDDGLVTVQ